MRILGALRSPQPPATEWALTDLLNEITAIRRDFVIILDDYHSIDSTAVDAALTFLLEHQPAHMHLVIATREDPHLPLAQWRTRGGLTELRASDLRFTSAEAAEFLNHAMGLQRRQRTLRPWKLTHWQCFRSRLHDSVPTLDPVDYR